MGGVMGGVKVGCEAEVGEAEVGEADVGEAEAGEAEFDGRWGAGTLDG